MVYYLDIIQSLWQQLWYWPAVLVLIVYFYNKQLKASAKLNTRVVSIWWLLFWGAVIFVVLSPAYWIFGDNAAHSFSDDVTHTLQTYLSSSMRGDSLNWTNGLSGGMDRWLLPNCHPASLGRLYALYFHKPHHLYLFIIAINVLIVFIFSWKIQVNFWQMRPWAAAIGSVIAVIIQGYWTGIYPDAHVSQGHGFAIIIIGIYLLTRFHEHRFFWLIALLVGVAMALGSWTPFHNLPPLLITVTIWGLIFWGPGAWQKVFKANILIVLVFMVLLFPYFLAIKLLFAETGRSNAFRPSVELAKLYLLPQSLVLMGMGLLAAVLGVFRDKQARQVLLLFLGFMLLPLISYVLEASKIMPSFRWQLLYAGNDAFAWLAVIFFIERIQLEIQNRWRLVGLTSWVLISSTCWVVIAFVWMNSLWLDLISSYPSGNWKALTDKSISTVLKAVDSKPVRVVGIDDTNDMHFWGQYQGMESMLGYTPFIDKRKTYFWWYGAMAPGLRGAYTAAWLSIPIPVPGHERNLDFPVPLSALVNLDALRLANVHWIISHHPLYAEAGLQKFINQPGQSAACHPTADPLSKIDLNSFVQYWKNVICVSQDYAYPRPMYVYRLEGALPRVYLASQVIPWPQDHPPVLSQQELQFAAQKVGFVDLKNWKEHIPLAEGQADFEIYQSDYMRIGIHASEESLVILSSTLNSYWKLLIDNRPTQFFDVNGFQTGFWVPAKSHEAEFIYCPPFRPTQDQRC